MKVFIDFDDVIFNTKEFVADLRIFFADNGINEEMFQKHYYTTDKKDGIKLFDPWAMFDRIEKNESLNMKKVRENFMLHISNLSGFVFEDVFEFLKFVGKENVYLVSFGLPVFQNEKIVSCGVSELVNGCIVTKDLKSEAINSVMREMKVDFNEEIFFIDDRIEQVEEIKKTLPKMHTFLLCRKEGRYCDEKNKFCDWEIHNLKEAEKIIKEFI